MKILALGATGAIGQQMADALVQQEHEVWVTSRRARPSVGSLHYVQGDAHDEIFLGTLLATRWDAIVDFMIYDTSSFSRRAEPLLRACSQYIYTSSARVFAQSQEPITERSPRLLDVSTDTAYLATDEYALTKARQEDMLHAAATRNWTIVRPYISFGDGRLQLGSLEKESWLHRALNGRSIVFCDALLDRVTTMTDGSDVARMLTRLVGNEDAFGEDFNLVSKENISWRDVLDLYVDGIAAHLGEPPKVILQDLEAFVQTASSQAQIRYDRLYDRRFDPSKIGQIFELSTLPDTLQALKHRLANQLQSGDFLPVDWRLEALRDRYTHEHASLDEIRGIKDALRYLGYRHAAPLIILGRKI